MLIFRDKLTNTDFVSQCYLMETRDKNTFTFVLKMHPSCLQSSFLAQSRLPRQSIKVMCCMTTNEYSNTLFLLPTVKLNFNFITMTLATAARVLIHIHTYWLTQEASIWKKVWSMKRSKASFFQARRVYWYPLRLLNSWMQARQLGALCALSGETRNGTFPRKPFRLAATDSHSAVYCSSSRSELKSVFSSVTYTHFHYVFVFKVKISIELFLGSSHSKVLVS